MRIVTDSTCDISRDIVVEFDISVVPAYVLFGEQSYRQGIDINPTQFYAWLQSSSRLPSTSQPTPGDFTQCFEPLIAAGHQVLCITVPQQLSGTYNSATQAASRFDDGAVTIIDAGTASVGHLLQVIAAAEDAAVPDASLESVVQAARDRANSGYTYAIVDTLEYLQKGGRIGKAQAFVGSLLSVKPILTLVDGEVHPLERPRNHQRAMRRLVDLVKEKAPASRLGVIYSTEQDWAAELCESLSDVLPREQIVTARFGPALGTYVGPRAVGVAIVSEG